MDKIDVNPLVDINEPEPEIRETVKEDSFAQFMNPPEPENADEDNEAMHNVAAVYCNISNSDLDTCIGVLRGMGMDTWEKIYRALPIYLRRIGKGVDTAVLIEYCKILGDLYGTCDLEFKN